MVALALLNCFEPGNKVVALANATTLFPGSKQLNSKRFPFNVKMKLEVWPHFISMLKSIIFPIIVKMKLVA